MEKPSSEIMTADELLRIAYLARLQIKTEKIPAYAQSINRIFSMISVLAEIPTEGVQPMQHPLNCVQPYRADEVTEPNLQAQAIKLAPEHAAGLLLVPQVIE